MGWSLLAAIAGGWCWAFYRHPLVTAGGTITLVALLFLELRSSHRYFQRLTNARVGESICTFARAAPREVDTWIVRAVYEQVQENLGSGKIHVPVRWEDNFSTDLKVADDLELVELAEEISQRTGLSADGNEENPYYGKVHTVGDLVMYFHHQPRSGAA